jgi:hypothetical protein
MVRSEDALAIAASSKGPRTGGRGGQEQDRQQSPVGSGGPDQGDRISKGIQKGR